MNTIQLENRMGIVFKNKALLRQALTHRSYLNEHRGENLQHNERLEYLGDAVLELIVSTYLFHNFPEDVEGNLTEKRSVIACGDSAAKVAKNLGVEQFLLLSRGEMRDTGSRARTTMIADAFEAIIGALYLDRGYVVTEEFVHRILLSGFKEKMNARTVARDAKSTFQEVVQRKFDCIPTYHTLKESGPDHDRTFTVGAYINTDLMARGEGKTKKEAERDAATKALALL